MLVIVLMVNHNLNWLDFVEHSHWEEAEETDLVEKLV